MALRAMDPHRWDHRAIAAALRMSKAWVTKALATPAAQKAIAAAEAKADPVADALRAAADRPIVAGSTDADITAMERAIADQEAILPTIKDPIAQANARTKLGEMRVKLARVRLAARKDAAPARDASLLRAGRQAEDRLRVLLEEALGEKLEGPG